MYSDIVVVGGGMTGSLLACALGASKLFSKVSVLESALLPYSQSQIPDPRVVTLTPSSQRFMSSIGVWDLISPTRVSDFKGMQVWDFFGTGSMHFGEASGWVIENKEIVQAGLNRLKELEVEVISPAKLKKVERSLGEVKLELEDGKILETALVIGADGRDSKVRSEFGIAAWQRPYPHNGLVCIVRVENAMKIAYQRFLQTGPVALLPLWDDFYSVVWSGPPDLITNLEGLNDQDFLNQLNLAISAASLTTFPSEKMISWPVLTEVSSKRFSFPYRLTQAQNYAEARVALIGDAAHTIHPMAGQGFNLGVYDAANLANALCKAARVGRDPGDLSVLQQYECQAKRYNLLFAGFEELILSWFNSWPLMNHIRNLKFEAVDRIPSLKDLFLSGANGTQFIPEKFEWESR